MSFSRTEMIRRRAALSVDVRDQVALQITRHVDAAGLLDRISRLAIYWPVRGEADGRRIVARATEQDIAVYVPVLDGQSLLFAEYVVGETMENNRFGIPEPCGPRIGAAELDLVFCPLTAFDRSGNRVGMGGGFYDRTFAEPANRPRLIGLGYDFQRVAQIEPQPWDVPLTGVVTESGFTEFAHRE